MAEIKVPIQVNLPDDWVEQIVDRLRNDPDAEWVEIIRCKDCKWGDIYVSDGNRYCYCMMSDPRIRTADDFCSYAEREEA